MRHFLPIQKFNISEINESPTARSECGGAPFCWKIVLGRESSNIKRKGIYNKLKELSLVTVTSLKYDGPITTSIDKAH